MKTPDGKSFYPPLFLFLLPVFIFAETPAAPAVNETTLETGLPVPTSATPKTVINSDGSGVITAPDGSTSILPAPVLLPEIKSITPAKLYPGKCYPAVKIKGLNFSKNIVIKFNTGDIAVERPGEAATDTVELSVTIKKEAKPGPYDILFQNSPETAAVLKNAVLIMSQPEITAVRQKEIRQGTGNNEILLAGNSFLPGARVEFPENSGEITARQVSVNPEKEIKLEVEVSFAVKPGEVKFKVVNPDGESAGGRFVVTTALDIDSVLPGSVPQGAAGLELTLKGSNFSKALKAVSGAEGLTVNSIFVLSGNEAALNISVSALALPGKKELILSAPDGGSRKFYISISSRPVLESIIPDQAPQGAENRILTLTGNNFNKDTLIKFSSTGIRIIGYELRPPRQLLVQISVSSRAPAGTFDVTAAAQDGGTDILKKAFSINLKPELKALSPASAVQGAFEQEIEIAGRGFTKNTVLKIDGEGIFLKGTEYSGPFLLKTRLTVGLQVPPGKKGLFLYNPDGGSLALPAVFEINKIDKGGLYFGEPGKFSKPARINKKKAYLECPLYQEIIRENIAAESSRYGQIINKVEEALTAAYKSIQKKYNYDLIGETGYITGEDGEPAKEIPDITGLVIKEFEKQ